MGTLASESINASALHQANSLESTSTQSNTISWILTKQDSKLNLLEERNSVSNSLTKRWKSITGLKDPITSGSTLLLDKSSECGSHGMDLKSGTQNPGASMTTATSSFPHQKSASQDSSSGPLSAAKMVILRQTPLFLKTTSLISLNEVNIKQFNL